MQRLPGSPDLEERFASKPRFDGDVAPHAVDWWAASNAGAVTVQAIDFASGYMEIVTLPATGAPQRLFPQGMPVREPMLLNMSAVAFEFGFRPNLGYADGQPAFRVPGGMGWTKYGLFIFAGVGGIGGGLLGNVRVQDGAGAQLTGVSGGTSDGAADAVGLIFTRSRLEAFNGASWDRLRMANSFDPTIAPDLVAIMPFVHLYNIAGAASNSVALKGLVSYANTSPVNTQLQIVIPLSQLHDTLAILMACSAGTATLTIEVSIDAATWTTIDSTAAAASTVKQYTATTVGGTVALSPLAFRYIRVTAGPAGAGNTTTLTISAK